MGLRDASRLTGASLLAQIVPLMLGFGAVQFFIHGGHDVREGVFSGDQTGFYVGAGTLSRALLWLVLPLATVMFPKIVHSAARSEKSNLLGLVLLGTTVLAGGGALGLTVLGPWIVKIVFKESLSCRSPPGAAVVCVGDGAAVAGERAGQQSAGARRNSASCRCWWCWRSAYGFAR